MHRDGIERLMLNALSKSHVRPWVAGPATPSARESGSPGYMALGLVTVPLLRCADHQPRVAEGVCGKSDTN